jgi:superfamily II DNA helicase RecQ
MSMVERGALQLLCVDEAPLFVQFGPFFRKEFIQLKGLLFEKLLLNPTSSYTKRPVLFMTATANKTIVVLSQLERITSYSFQKQHYVFCPAAPQICWSPRYELPFHIHRCPCWR